MDAGRFGALESWIVRAATQHAQEQRAGAYPVIAVVTNCDDPAGLGRVKCAYVTSAGEQVESGWVRCLGLGAGATRGLYVLPDVGTEVLVDFEHGEPGAPLVLGCLATAKHAPPIACDQDNAKRGLRTAAGIEIWFDDAASGDQPAITLSGPGGEPRVEISDNGLTLTTTGALSLLSAGTLDVVADEVAISCMNGKLAGAKGVATAAGSTTELKGGSITAQAPYPNLAMGGAQATVPAVPELLEHEDRSS